jgi:type I restriction enzyme, R subunit
MSVTSEYEVETLFIDRLESIGYSFIDLKNYDDVIKNFRIQLALMRSFIKISSILEASIVLKAST